MEPARKKAEAAGVKDIFIDDLREEFVKDYVFPMFRWTPCICTATGLVGILSKISFWPLQAMWKHLRLWSFHAIDAIAMACTK